MQNAAPTTATPAETTEAPAKTAEDKADKATSPKRRPLSNLFAAFSKPKAAKPAEKQPKEVRA